MSGRRIRVRYYTDMTRGHVMRHKRSFGDCNSARKSSWVLIRVDLGRNWTEAEKEAWEEHRSQFEKFVNELVDTLAHEYVHAFEPFYVSKKASEDKAKCFAEVARQAQRNNR